MLSQAIYYSRTVCHETGPKYKSTLNLVDLPAEAAPLWHALPLNSVMTKLPSLNFNPLFAYSSILPLYPTSGGKKGPGQIKPTDFVRPTQSRRPGSLAQLPAHAAVLISVAAARLPIPFSLTKSKSPRDPVSNQIDPPFKSQEIRISI